MKPFYCFLLSLVIGLVCIAVYYLLNCNGTLLIIQYPFEDIISKKHIMQFFFDIGNGLITVSLASLFFIYANKINKWSDFKRIRSLRKISLFFLTNLSWLLLIPGSYLYYYVRALQGRYPSYADTVFIPIYYKAIFICIMLIPINLFLFICLTNSSHPTVFRDCKYNLPNKAKRIKFFFDTVIIILAFLLASLIIDGDHISIIVCLIMIYIIEALKFGKINNTSVT